MLFIIAFLGDFGFLEAAMTAARFLRAENEPGGWHVINLKLGTPSILFRLCCSRAASRAAVQQLAEIVRQEIGEIKGGEVLGPQG